jgi:hypothetical protein
MSFLRGRAHISANAYYRIDPGNIAALPDDRGAAIRLSFGF